jgi:hypothetical protein
MNILIQIFLILIATAIIVYSLITSFSSTKAGQSMLSLTQYLSQFDSKFKAPGRIDAEAERKEMELLQNKVKACCEQKEISSNTGLKLLTSGLRKKINEACARSNAVDQASWIKLKEVTSNFEDTYFPLKG